MVNIQQNRPSEYISTGELDSSKEREVSCRVIVGVLRYLESQGYQTESLLQDLPYSRQHLSDPFNWVNHETREIVCQRAVTLTHNEFVMFQVGLSSPALKPFGGLEALVRLIGSPGTAYSNVAKFAGFFDHTLLFKSTGSGENRVMIDMSVPQGYGISRNSCYLAQGLLAAVPVLWGLPPAEVREIQHMCGAGPVNGTDEKIPDPPSCSYEITWQALPPLSRRFWDTLSRKKPDAASALKQLEHSFALLDRKNAELTHKNRQLAKVREMALAVDGVTTIEKLYQTVVEMARDIHGVRFVVILKEAGDHIVLPYYSRIRNKSLVASLRAIGFDLNNALGEHPNSEKFRFLSASSRLVQEYRNNPKVVAFSAFSHLMQGIWPEKMCDAIQKIAGIINITLVPIIVEGESWGSMLFFLNDEVHQDILEMVGAHCSSAIKNTLALDRLKKRNAELAAMNRIASSTSKSLVIDALFSSSLEEIMRIYQADSAAIYLFDAEKQGLKLVSQRGMSAEIAKNPDDHVQKNSPVFRFFSSAEEMMTGKLDDHAADFHRSAGLSTAKVPLHFISGIINQRSRRNGVLTVVRQRNNPFTDEEKNLLKAICNQLAAGIENSYLHSDVLRRMSEAENARKDLQTALDCQRKVENELKHSEEKYKTIFESANDIILLLDTAGRIIAVNAKVKEVAGYDQDSFIGQDFRTLTGIISKKSIATVALNFLKLIAGFKVAPYEVEMCKKEGSKTDIEINSTALRKDGKIYGVLAILRDVTERKQAMLKLEQQNLALQESEEYQRQLLSSMLTGVVTIDAQTHQIVDINPFASRLFGTRPEDIIGHVCHDFLCPAETGKCPVTDPNRKADFSDGYLVKSDGSKSHIIKNVFNIKRGSGHYLIETITDIEPLKQAQADLMESEMRFKALYEQEKQERVELEEEIKARARFINILAHELRTPLTPVLVSVNMAHDLLSSNPDHILYKTINNALNGAESLRIRLEDLLDLARFSQGIFKLKRQLIDIAEFLNLTVLRYKPALDQKHQQLVIQIAPDLPKVEADPSRLEQVVLNLLSNCGKYSPENSVITLRAMIRNYSILIEVQDQGIGITPEEQKNLFMPYHRAEQDRQSYPGTGLGLAVTKQIIEAHQGKIWVESERGKGCTFKFTLPVNTAATDLDVRNCISPVETEAVTANRSN